MKGVVIAGTGSGVGKTSIATGLMSRLAKRYKVQAFKCGPDFIDPMYHTAATGRPSRNLDSFLLSDDRIRNLVGWAAADADVCVIEGVRGLYEGFSGDGDLGSTAYIAKLLGLPVILVVNAASLTRSAAAVINGFRAFDPQVNIAGVILNNVSGGQHADKLDTALRTYCPGLAVLGKVRKDREHVLGQRYLGLQTLHTFAQREIAPLEALTGDLDLDQLMGAAEQAAGELPTASPFVARQAGLTAAVPVDDAFCFYYRENLECLAASGVRVRTFRPAEGQDLPPADLIYLGGGYPELYAEQLARNRNFLEGLKQASDAGRPVLGECGGLMTLCRTLTAADGKTYPMAGALPAAAVMTGVRHGPTYVMAEAADNPLFAGSVRGHEYHYSDAVPDEGARFAFEVKRGRGIRDGQDGLCRKQTVGTYLHQHALSAGDWAGGLVAAAGRVRD